MKEAENREIATMNLWIFVRDSDFAIVNETLCQWEIMNGSAYTCYLGRIILQVNTVRSIGGSEQDHSSRSDFNKIPENASIQSIYIYMERDRGCKINTYIYRFRIADDIWGTWRSWEDWALNPIANPLWNSLCSDRLRPWRPINLQNI